MEREENAKVLEKIAAVKNKVLRGGAWRFSADNCRSGYRYNENPGSADVCFGYDIYGFPMSEAITANGASTVSGKKAFKYIQSVTPVGTVGAPEPRMLTVQVWDKSMVSSVEKAIRESGLGLNPAADGMTIRVPIPQLTTERRNELVKMAHKYAEAARIAVRGVRRDGMEQIKAQEKKKTIGEDIAKQWSDEVQKLTDQYVKKVDETLGDKEKDIKQV